MRELLHIVIDSAEVTAEVPRGCGHAAIVLWTFECALLVLPVPTSLLMPGVVVFIPVVLFSINITGLPCGVGLVRSGRYRPGHSCRARHGGAGGLAVLLCVKGCGDPGAPGKTPGWVRVR